MLLLLIGKGDEAAMQPHPLLFEKIKLIVLTLSVAPDV
jgi:hypothetical protein